MIILFWSLYYVSTVCLYKYTWLFIMKKVYINNASPILHINNCFVVCSFDCSFIIFFFRWVLTMSWCIVVEISYVTIWCRRGKKVIYYFFLISEYCVHWCGACKSEYLKSSPSSSRQIPPHWFLHLPTSSFRQQRL